MRRALLLGGSGQLGTEIRREWTGYEIVAPAHAELDLENAQELDAMLERLSPGVVVNCAAFHKVDQCEELPERAFAVNAIAVERLARICRGRGLAFATISTDYVFDGATSRPYTEEDRPQPISAYGVSKYAGELLVQSLQSNALIVRTCGLYGVRPSQSKGYTFVDRIIAQARAGQSSRIVRDVIASPTFAGHLAQALRRLIDAGAAGVYHAVNSGPVSWYDFACEALRQAGVAGTIEPISAGEWKAPARRPAYSALENVKLRTLGIEMPSWQDGISAYLKMVDQCS